MDEEKSKLLEAADKGVKKNYLMSKALLKKHFRILYENAGMEWTEENDNEIEFIVNATKRCFSSFLHNNSFFFWSKFIEIHIFILRASVNAGK